MNNLSRKLILNLLVISLIHVVLAMNGIAQTSTAAQKHQGLAHLQDLEKRFGPHFATRLSSGGANSFQASRMLAKLQARGVAMQPRHANGALEANARSHAALLLEGDYGEGPEAIARAAAQAARATLALIQGFGMTG